MQKRFTIFSLLIITIFMIFITGCTNDKDKIAYISSNTNSEYEKTFKDLQLGIIYDFNLKLPYADKSWVNIWVEGYRDGKPMEPSILTELSYGFSPQQVEEGRMGFGIINSNNDIQLFLYSAGIHSLPQSVDNNLFSQSAISSWDYAIGSKEIGLKSGEEKIIAVYRRAENSIRTYDYQDIDSLNKMIEEDTTVLLLKIKVEERNE